MAHTITGASLTEIYNRLNSAPRYKPMEANTFADWSVEAGDTVTVSRNGTSASAPVFSSSMTWRKGQQITLTSEGNRERPAVSKVSRNKYNRGSSGIRNSGRMYDYYVNQEHLLYAVFDTDGRFSQLEVTVHGLVHEVYDSTGRFSRLANTVYGLQSEVYDLNTGYSVLSNTVSGMSSEVYDLSGNYSILSNTVSGMSSEVYDLTGNYSVLSNTVSGMSSEVYDLNTGYSVLQNTVSGMSSEVYELNGSYSRLNNTVQGLYHEVYEPGGSYSRLNNTVTGLYHEVYEPGGRYSRLNNTVQGLYHEVYEPGGGYSRLNNTVQGLYHEVYEPGGAVSSLKNDANGFRTRISKVVDANGTIKAAEISTAINDSGSSVYIEADHIRLNGQTLVSQMLTGQATIAALKADSLQIKPQGGMGYLNVDSCINTALVQNGNLKLYNMRGEEVVSFSKAVSSWQGAWSGRTLTVTVQPQNQSSHYWLYSTLVKAGSASHAVSGGHHYAVQKINVYSDEDGTDTDAGSLLISQTVSIDADLVYNDVTVDSITMSDETPVPESGVRTSVLLEARASNGRYGRQWVSLETNTYDSGAKNCVNLLRGGVIIGRIRTDGTVGGTGLIIDATNHTINLDSTSQKESILVVPDITIAYNASTHKYEYTVTALGDGEEINAVTDETGTEGYTAGRNATLVNAPTWTNTPSSAPSSNSNTATFATDAPSPASGSSRALSLYLSRSDTWTNNVRTVYLTHTNTTATNRIAKIDVDASSIYTAGQNNTAVSGPTWTTTPSSAPSSNSNTATFATDAPSPASGSSRALSLYLSRSDTWTNNVRTVYLSHTNTTAANRIAKIDVDASSIYTQGQTDAGLSASATDHTISRVGSGTVKTFTLSATAGSFNQSTHKATVSIKATPDTGSLVQTILTAEVDAGSVYTQGQTQGQTDAGLSANASNHTISRVSNSNIKSYTLSPTVGSFNANTHKATVSIKATPNTGSLVQTILTTQVDATSVYSDGWDAGGATAGPYEFTPVSSAGELPVQSLAYDTIYRLTYGYRNHNNTATPTYSVALGPVANPTVVKGTWSNGNLSITKDYTKASGGESASVNLYVEEQAWSGVSKLIRIWDGTGQPYTYTGTSITVDGTSVWNAGGATAGLASFYPVTPEAAAGYPVQPLAASTIYKLQYGYVDPSGVVHNTSFSHISTPPGTGALEDKGTVTRNGTYLPSAGYDGISRIVVSVPQPRRVYVNILTDTEHPRTRYQFSNGYGVLATYRVRVYDNATSGQGNVIFDDNVQLATRYSDILNLEDKGTVTTAGTYTPSSGYDGIGSITFSKGTQYTLYCTAVETGTTGVKTVRFSVQFSATQSNPFSQGTQYNFWR